MSEEFWKEACYFWEISHEAALSDIASLRAERDEAREIARELVAWIRSVGRVETTYMSQRELADWRRIRPGVRRWLEE